MTSNNAQREIHSYQISFERLKKISSIIISILNNNRASLHPLLHSPLIFIQLDNIQREIQNYRILWNINNKNKIERSWIHFSTSNIPDILTILKKERLKSYYINIYYTSLSSTYSSNQRTKLHRESIRHLSPLP